MSDAAVAPAPAEPAQAPKFTQGSTMRHVIVMTATGSVGLMAIFFVDLLSLLYISWLGRAELTAGVGFATVVLFFGISISIGLLIAVSALVSRALGERDRDKARRLAASTVTLTGLVTGSIGLLALPVVGPLLTLLGAAGETHAVAQRFLFIVLPSNVLLGVGFAFSGVLRAAGDAKRSMYVTLAGGVATAITDPILIFGLKLGVDGAAIATVFSRVIFVAVGFWGAVLVHRLVALPRGATVLADARPMFAIALPAIAANVAAPAANAFVAAIVARFGAPALAAIAIIDRIVPIAFGAIFALTGAIGPILGQNWGARRLDRVHGALRDAFVFVSIYVALAWAILVALRHVIPSLFNVAGTATGELITFFCLISGPTWYFIGLLFVGNTAFNNLGYPAFSMGFNWGRATLGTVPFAALGASLAGVEGALVGIGAGAFAFGIAATATSFWVVRRLTRQASHHG